MASPFQSNRINFQPIPLLGSNDYHESGDSLIPLPLSDQHAFTVQFISKMRGFLHDPLSKEKYRRNIVDFTRDRCFSFPSLAVTIIKDRTRSAQDRLIRLFEDGAFGDYPTCPTASAFYQARSKLLPAFFKDWTSFAISTFYSVIPTAGIVDKFHGRLLWAIDCTYLTLPDTIETRDLYYVHKNNVPGSETVQGLASFAYDLLNDFPVNVSLGKRQFEANFIVDHHALIENHAPIILYDRAYANYDTIAQTLAAKADFIIRCPLSQTFKVVEEFIASDAIEETVMIQVQPNKKRLAIERGWPLTVQVRLVKVVLDDGIIEVLITSLLDREEYPHHVFKWLYGKRWGAETGFLRFKVQLEAECFSSGKAWNINQDFHATVFLQVLESIVNKIDNHDILTRSQMKQLKHEYHVNKVIAFTAISIHLVDLFLLDQDALEFSLYAIQKEVRLCVSPIRPGRHCKREIPKVAKSLKYHKYKKKRR
jgi:hypothetical protein